MRVDYISGNSRVYCLQVSHSSTNAGYGGGIGFVALLTEDGIRSEDIDGFISHGPKNHLGERKCRHLTFKGHAVALSSRVMRTSFKAIKLHKFGPAQNVLHTSLLLYNDVWKEYSRQVFCGMPDTFHQSLPDTPLDMELPTRNHEFSVCYTGSGYSVKSTYETYNKRTNVWDLFLMEYTIYLSSDFSRYKEGSTGTWYNLPYLRKLPTPSDAVYCGFPSSMKSFYTTSLMLKAQYGKLRDWEVYGDLVRRCANDARVISSNALELTKELREISATFRSLAGLFRGKLDPKKLASGYLQYKYGLRLTVKDLLSIQSDISQKLTRAKDSYRFARAKDIHHLSSPYPSRGDCEAEFCYKLFHSSMTTDWRNSIRQWFDSGLFPSLQNSWDLIPLSFVMDWFAHIESYLDGIDANTYWSLYDILGVTYSEKRTYHDIASMFETPGYTLSGSINFVDYSRQIGTTAHQPLFFDPSPREFRNYAELTSLVVVGLR